MKKSVDDNLNNIKPASTLSTYFTKLQTPKLVATCYKENVNKSFIREGHKVGLSNNLTPYKSLSISNPKFINTCSHCFWISPSQETEHNGSGSSTMGIMCLCCEHHDNLIHFGFCNRSYIYFTSSTYNTSSAYCTSCLYTEPLDPRPRYVLWGRVCGFNHGYEFAYACILVKDKCTYKGPLITWALIWCV